MKDARLKLSAMVDDAANGEPSLITRYGRPCAVMLGFEEWQRLSAVPSFAHLLMSAPDGFEEFVEHDRSPHRVRTEVAQRPSRGGR